ncbi:MAG: ethanolamine utilization protein EutN [Myxococcaceae bacterium]|nr:ethanolamine utilization protein EutN [Myxococcaceae bacterium]
MMLAKVVGTVVCTIKRPDLARHKLLVCKRAMDDGQGALDFSANLTVALDLVGAGTGDLVLLTIGSAASHGVEPALTIDASVTGIVDEFKLEVCKEGL